MEPKSKSKKSVKAKTEDVKYKDEIRHLAKLVVEIIATAKKDKDNIFCKHAGIYIQQLDSVNCNAMVHHKLYAELYTDYKDKWLSTKKDVEWMNKESNPISAHLGKADPSLKKRNMVLKISVAANCAIKMRHDIENKKYANINDKEEAYGDYKYQYLDLLFYRLFSVMVNALTAVGGFTAKEISRLTALATHFRSLTHLKPKEEGEESSDSEEGISLGKIAGKLTGKNVPTKEITGAIEKITSNENITDKMSDIFNSAEEAKKKGASNKEMFASMFKNIGPLLDELEEGVNANKEGSDSSSSDEESGSD